MQDISISRSHDLSQISGLARAVQATLTLKEGACLWAGVPCSTFIWLSRGTFKRTPESPWGEFTDVINCVVMRFVYVAVVAILRRAYVVMEQPLSSTLRYLPPIQMLALLCQNSWGEARLLLDWNAQGEWSVYLSRTVWWFLHGWLRWLGLFGHANAKPTYLIGNACLDRK